MTSDRIASSLARPPALRITCASPSLRPAYFAGSSLASMQVRIAKPRAGGRASSLFAPNEATYCSFALRTSSRTPTRLLLLQMSAYQAVCRSRRIPSRLSHPRLLPRPGYQERDAVARSPRPRRDPPQPHHPGEDPAADAERKDRL